MATSPVGSTSNTGSSSQTKDNNPLGNLEMDQFLKLMISGLQNQDPLSPMENSQILEQISQIREIGASTQMTSTLNAVLLGQNLSSATTMIGQQIDALTDSGETVNGIVDKVTVSNGDPRLHIGETSIKLTNVRSVEKPAA
ncbi:MAG: flagellar hook capping FlgD N-terminal domain-containing protein [Planctomycetota bacterium]|nr:flagellar hook capping FlgD N-terminal domain-containing protein [Planctomycetota bacterium]